MSDTTNDDLLIGSITIHRYLNSKDGGDYHTIHALDATGEELPATEAFGMLEIGRLHFASIYLGIDNTEDDMEDE